MPLLSFNIIIDNSIIIKYTGNYPFEPANILIYIIADELKVYKQLGNCFVMFYHNKIIDNLANFIIIVREAVNFKKEGS